MGYIGNTPEYTVHDDTLKRFDYVEPFDPLASVIPTHPNAVWLNSVTGRVFHCTDNSPSGSYWNVVLGD